MKGFLGFQTLAIKSFAMPLSIGSGLSVGKEGPSVHYAVCTGNVISRFFEKYRRNASNTREVLTSLCCRRRCCRFRRVLSEAFFLS